MKTPLRTRRKGDTKSSVPNPLRLGWRPTVFKLTHLLSMAQSCFHSTLLIISSPPLPVKLNLPPGRCPVTLAAAGRQGRQPLANRAPAVPGSTCCRRTAHDPDRHRSERSGSSFSGNRFPVPLLVTLMGRCVGFSSPAKHPEALVYGRGMRGASASAVGPGHGPVAEGCVCRCVSRGCRLSLPGASAVGAGRCPARATAVRAGSACLRGPVRQAAAPWSASRSSWRSAFRFGRASPWGCWKCRSGRPVRPRRRR